MASEQRAAVKSVESIGENATLGGADPAPETGIDWADAFDNFRHVPNAAEILKNGSDEARAFRESASNAEFDVAYGPGPREVMDLYWPTGTPRGLAVFLHGGYWHKLSKDDWSHMAAGALAAGWAMAIPSYPLAPEARLGEMVRATARAVEAAAARVAGPIRIAGHSAGGHLALRLACADAPMSTAVARRVARVVSISGLHDLRPLRRAPMNATLGIDAAEARAESPALLAPRAGSQIVLWVGAEERPELIRQTALMAEAWQGRVARLRRVIENERHHFDVVDGLFVPGSPLGEAFLGRD
ncbi:alpha/beta hydrolase [Pseudooceanicola sp. 200-1SW]|uniref:alpha/beta hydrolase n=1 Tax=Pseudooceanicola sp. 200-1SW TaxID=3425949 RepID=UPI003D7FC73C